MSDWVNIDIPTIQSAGNQFGDAHNEMVTALFKLTGDLAMTGGMAGGDTRASDFTQGYDSAAKAAMTATTLVINALAAQHEMLITFCNNHLAADSASTITPVDTEYIPKWVLLNIEVPTLPSALKNTADEPHWWHYLSSHVEGIFWPNGDTDKLNNASGVWQTCAKAFRATASKITPGILREQVGDGIEEAHGWSAAQVKCINDLADKFDEMNTSLEKYAESVKKAHDGIAEALEDFVKWTIYIEAGAAVLAFFTVGASEIIGNAVEGGKFASAASKIKEFIDVLISELSFFGPKYVKMASELTGKGSISYKIGPLATARAVVFEAETVGITSGLGASANAITKTAPTLSKLLRRPYLRKATREAIIKKTDRITIDGKEFFVSKPLEDVLVPVDKTYPDWVTKLPLDKSGNYYVDEAHNVMYSRDPRWHFGHVEGRANKDLIKNAQERGITQQQFNDEINSHPQWFQIQDPHSNWSHQYE